MLVALLQCSLVFLSYPIGPIVDSRLPCYPLTSIIYLYGSLDICLSLSDFNVVYLLLYQNVRADTFIHSLAELEISPRSAV